jgi:hypothetical protein
MINKTKREESKMIQNVKKLIVIVAVFVSVGCAGEGFVFAEGGYTNYKEISHTQKCVFLKDMTLRRGGVEIVAMEGDTIDIPDVTIRYGCYDENDLIFGYAQIDTGSVDTIDTLTQHYQFSEFFSADSTWITVYHSGVSTVSVEW